MAQASGVRPGNFSAVRAARSVFRMSPGTISTFSRPAMVSDRMGRRDRSSSTETTRPARRESSWVRGPMPGPPHPGALPGEGADAGAHLQHTAGRGGAGCLRNIPGHPVLHQKILPHGLGEVKAVPGQQGLDLLDVAQIHKRSLLKWVGRGGGAPAWKDKKSPEQSGLCSGVAEREGFEPSNGY